MDAVTDPADTAAGPDPADLDVDASVIRHTLSGQLPETLLVFTPEEAASILRVSRASLYRRIRAKKIPHRTLGDGTGYRFTGEDLREILAESYRPPVSS